MRILFFSLAFFILVSNSAIAQGWSELGTGSAALHANNFISSVCADPSGNIYAAGWFRDSTISVYVAKWNGTSWSELGAPGALHTPAAINSMIVDSSGNIYAAVAHTDTSIHWYTVVKWDGSSWSELGTLNGMIMAMSFDRHGYLYATGGIVDTSAHACVVKWDGAAWNEVGTGVHALKANQVIDAMYIDSMDNIYVGGYFTDSGTTDTTGNIYVAKWDGTSWSELGSGICRGYDVFSIFAITGDASGNIYASGFIVDSTYHSYVAKWDGTAWSALGTGPNSLHGNNWVCTMITGSDGNIYVAGRFSDSAAFTDGHKYVAKWDGTSWNQVGSGAGKLNANDDIYSMCFDAAGNMYAAGQFTDASGYKYVAKYSGVPAAVTTPEVPASICLFPNPADNQLTITSSGAITDIAISNLSGQIVYTGRNNANRATIDVADMPPGLYLVRINNSVVRKFLRQ